MSIKNLRWKNDKKVIVNNIKCGRKGYERNISPSNDSSMPSSTATTNIPSNSSSESLRQLLTVLFTCGITRNVFSVLWESLTFHRIFVHQDAFPYYVAVLNPWRYCSPVRASYELNRGVVLKAMSYVPYSVVASDKQVILQSNDAWTWTQKEDIT